MNLEFIQIGLQTGSYKVTATADKWGEERLAEGQRNRPEGRFRATHAR